MRPSPWARRWGSAARMSWIEPDQVGGDDALDLLVGQLLGRRRTAPYPALLMMTSMRPSSANARFTTARTAGVSRHVEHLGSELLRVRLDEVGDLADLPDGPDDAVAALEELLNEAGGRSRG